MRGVAILLVVVYHVGIPGFTGGFVGVDAFFVLSGYLITRLLLQELGETGRIGLYDFYARRMRRLLPAGSVVLLSTLVISVLVHTPTEVATTAETAQSAAAFASNIAFAAHSADYFRSSVETNPLLHTWSLSVEEQFYLAWPVIVLLAAGRHARRRRLGWVLVVIGAASLAYSWWLTIADRPKAFYGTPTRAWEFATGAFLVLIPERAHGIGTVRPLAAVLAGWCGVALVAVAAASFSTQTSFPGMSATIPVFGTALLLVGGQASSRGSVRQVLTSRVLQWVGRHSYGWYLWHWPLLVLGTSAFVSQRLTLRISLALVALGLAVIMRRLVEEPCRRAPVLQAEPKRTVVLGLALVGTLLVVTTGLGQFATRASQSPLQRAFTAARHDLPGLYRDGCGPDLLDSVPRLCELGIRGARPSVLVFGDSHTAQWVPALETIATRRGWRLLVMTKSACPSADAPVFAPVLGRLFTECIAWRRAALDTIRARRPDLIVISNSTEYVLGGPRQDAMASVSALQWEQSLGQTLATLQALALRTVVVQDTPEASENIPICLSRAVWRHRATSVCDFSRATAFHLPAVQAVRRAVALFPEVQLIDLTDSLCSTDRCAAISNGVVRYRDTRHLTATGSAKLAPALSSALEAAGLPVGLR